MATTGQLAGYTEKCQHQGQLMFVIMISSKLVDKMWGVKAKQFNQVERIDNVSNYAYVYTLFTYYIHIKC